MDLLFNSHEAEDKIFVCKFSINVFVCKFSKNVKSKLYYIEISKTDLDEVDHYEDLLCLQIQLFSSLLFKELTSLCVLSGKPSHKSLQQK